MILIAEAKFTEHSIPLDETGFRSLIPKQLLSKIQNVSVERDSLAAALNKGNQKKINQGPSTLPALQDGFLMKQGV